MKNLAFFWLTLVAFWGNAHGQSPITVIVQGEETITEGNSGVKQTPFFIGYAFAQGGPSSVSLRYNTKNGTATAGSDYVAKTGTITLTSANPNTRIMVDINGDTTVENDEDFFFEVRFSTDLPSDPPAGSDFLQILNDDGITPPNNVPRFVVNNAGLREGNSGLSDMRFRISKTDPASTVDVTVNYQTQNATAIAGADYQARQGTLTLTRAAPFADVVVSIIGDTQIEPLEFFLLNASDAIAGLPSQSEEGSIFDDDAQPPPPNINVVSLLPAFAFEPSTGETQARMAVRLLRQSVDPIVVNISAVPGPATTATIGVDFTGPSSTTLTFAPGETVKQIPFQILADSLVEPEEFAAYRISTSASNVVIDNSQARISISDPEPDPDQIASARIVLCRPFVGENLTARLLVQRVGSTTAALSVRYATQDGSALAAIDYVAQNGQLSWPAGDAEIKTIEVPMVDDAIVEPFEFFRVQLSDASGTALIGAAAEVIVVDSLDHIFNEDFGAQCAAPQ
jgi:hypothetical protein